MTQVPTTDQIRHAIDSGATGEKVAFPDPAAAPLGTDAEAAGHTPTVQERKMEARAQVEHRHRARLNGVAMYLGLVALVVVAVVVMRVVGF